MMNTSEMSRQEQVLYHQIHPVKLVADWLPGLGSIYWMWQHQLVATLLVTFIPAVLASFVLIQTADLKPYRDSSFGHYLKRYMTPLWQGIRFSGQVVIWVGAWIHNWWVILLGLLVIIFGWAHGLLLPQKASEEG